MLSKRDKLYQAAEMNILRCPVCGGDLTRQGDDFACAARHRVNVNRKGCLNFLSSPVDSCYDAALFQASGGCLQPGAISRWRMPSKPCCRMVRTACWMQAAAMAGT